MSIHDQSAAATRGWLCVREEVRQVRQVIEMILPHLKAQTSPLLLQEDAGSTSQLQQKCKLRRPGAFKPRAAADRRPVSLPADFTPPAAPVSLMSLPEVGAAVRQPPPQVETLHEEMEDEDETVIFARMIFFPNASLPLAAF